jgi:hypothetical protein
MPRSTLRSDVTGKEESRHSTGPRASLCMNTNFVIR